MTHAGGSHGGSSGGSSGGDDDGLTVIVQKIPLPNWLKVLRPVAGTLRGLGQFIQEKGSFRAAVLSVVTGWIVGGILEIGGTIAGAVLLAFEPFVRAIGIGEAAFTRAFGAVGFELLETTRRLNNAVIDLVGVAGPLAPLITAAVIGGTLYLTYRLTVSLLGEIPILSTAVDFLGLRP